MKNWRREAALKIMPTMTENRVRTPWREFWRRFRRQHVALLAGAFVLLLIVVAFIAPWIAPFDAENYFDYDRLNEGPSLMHWFGKKHRLSAPQIGQTAIQRHGHRLRQQINREDPAKVREAAQFSDNRRHRCRNNGHFYRRHKHCQHGGNQYPVALRHLMLNVFRHLVLSCCSPESWHIPRSGCF